MKIYVSDVSLDHHEDGACGLREYEKDAEAMLDIDFYNIYGLDDLISAMIKEIMSLKSRVKELEKRAQNKG
jgi:hypothetical protein